MTSPVEPVVVYGATGYTGRLVVAELAARGVPLVLAGRSPDRLAAVGAEVPGGVEAIVAAPLDDERALRDAAGRGRVLVNCAGPFARTGDPVLRAAAAAGAHYVDTTGEQDWIQRVLTEHDADLRAAGVAAVPGMGFDYLPGDLLCHLVGAPLGPLERLEVAYHVENFGMTRGTQRSALEMLDGRDVVYEDGAWAPGGARPLRAAVVFPEPIGRQTVGRYPAGEVVTVPRHLDVRTVAARISTSSIAPRPVAGLVPYATPVVAVLMRTPVKGLLDRAIDRLPEGPPEDERRAVGWTIAVTATARDGRVGRGVVRGSDIYGLTARTIADAAGVLGDPGYAERGGLAPAQAFDPAATLDGLADFGVTYEVGAPERAGGDGVSAGTDRVCVIGAGSSGIAACHALGAKGIPYDCFEKGTQVGGNWRYRNDNGQSAAYRSLHINTSRRVMEFRSFPMPDHLPDFPSHFQIAAYFDDFVEHFGLREHIRFRTEVVRVAPATGGGWDVTTRPVTAPEGDGPGAPVPAGPETTARYRAVLVANGHHWDPRWPEPAFPGEDAFQGERMHAHAYDTPDVLQGRRVLVLGIGNSATDIAVEASRTATRTFLAMRRSAYVIPKYVFGRPMDEVQGGIASKVHVPLPLQRLSAGALLRVTVGRMTDYGLAEPDHRFLEAHPTVSGELLGRLGHGDIQVKPNIEAFVGGRTVRFVDGTEEELDLVVYCTGYRIRFPFLDEAIVSTQDNHVPLYRRVVAPDRPGLFFVGLLQPIGAVMPLAEAQSEWIAALLTGETALPSADAMRGAIAEEDAAMARQYVASKRHTIQVDFYDYLRLLARERRLGPAAATPTGPLRRVRGAARRVRALAGVGS